MPYDRRSFLKITSGVVASATLVRFASAAPSVTAGPSLGFSLYGMKTLPVPKALAECARIGYRNVEIPLLTGFATELGKLGPAERKMLVEQTAAHGLKISSLLVNMRLVGDEKSHSDNLETIKSAGALAHELAPNHPPIIQTIMGGKAEEWEATKDLMAKRLHAWGEAAAAVNAIVAVKAHIQMAVNSPERLLWIVKQAGHPAIVIDYDYSHFTTQGISLDESWAALASRTQFIHVKDATLEGKDVKFLLPGEGTTDYRHYFQLLKKSGYAGPVVVEVSSQIFNRPGYDPILSAEKSYAALSVALAASRGA